MKLDIDFGSLWRKVAEMGARERNFSLDDIWSDEGVEFDIELSTSGVEVKLEDLETTQGLLSVKGRQVVLFIPDQGNGIDAVLEDPEKGRRFHVADCRTLNEMKRKKRFERYMVTNNLSGQFPIYGKSFRSGSLRKEEAPLKVCKNCLSLLNYKGSESQGFAQKNKVFNNFNMQEFFSIYSSVFSRLPKKAPESVELGYVKNWREISASVREACSYVCQHCSVNLREYKHLLHVHHVNGVKHDNSRINLMPLCADCHRKEPFHQHMMVKREDTRTINRLRKVQGVKISESWQQVVRFSDPALHGIFDYCKRRNIPAPVVSYELKIQNGDTIVFDLAWPQNKLGVSVGEAVTVPGWTIFGVHDAIENLRKEYK